jgi:hypothetical protein
MQLRVTTVMIYWAPCEIYVVGQKQVDSLFFRRILFVVVLFLNLSNPSGSTRPWGLLSF